MYPDGFSLPKLTDGHMEMLQSVAGILEARRCLRLHQTLDTWDFVVSHGETATSLTVRQTEQGFKVGSFLSKFLVPLKYSVYTLSKLLQRIAKVFQYKNYKLTLIYTVPGKH